LAKQNFLWHGYGHFSNDNNSSKRIETPVTKKFTPEALKNFFKNIKEGVKI
jgi:hypothetical protein